VLVTTAIERAYREGSIRPIGSGSPNDEELAEGLYRLNALWKGIRATALGEVIHDWQLPNKTRTAPHDANNINQFFPQNLSGFNQPGNGWDEGDDTSGPGGGATNHRQHYPPINTRILCKVDQQSYSSATGTVTFTGLPVATQTLTIGDGDVYTFVAAAVNPFEVMIGADANETGDNLVAAVSSYSGYVFAENAAGVVTLTAQVSGVEGNDIILATDAVNTTLSGATLTGGASPAQTAYFPQFPYDGARMAIVDIGMTEALIIEGNGRYIEGSTSYRFEPGSGVREWLYRADIANWVYIGIDLVLGDDLPLPFEFDDFFVCGTAIRLCALDQLDPQPQTIQAFNLCEKKIMQRYYQPGIMSYGGQNAVPAMQNYNNYWGWGTNFRSGV